MRKSEEKDPNSKFPHCPIFKFFVVTPEVICQKNGTNFRPSNFFWDFSLLGSCVFMERSFDVQKYNQSKAHHIMKTPKPTHWLLSLGSLWSLSREHYEPIGINTKDRMLKEEKLTLWWNQCPQLLPQVKWGRRSEQLSRGSLWTPSGAGWWEW